MSADNPFWREDLTMPEPFVPEDDEIACECKRCPRCDGAGVEHWYLGDEFNSHGESTCDICLGVGVTNEDCPLHHD